MYTVCANRHIFLLTLPCCCVCMHHVCCCILCLVWKGDTEGWGWVGEECHSPHRKGFHPGLIRANAGGDRWLVERNGDCCCSPLMPDLSSPLTTLPKHTHTARKWCVCMFAYSQAVINTQRKTQLNMDINVPTDRLSVIICLSLSWQLFP